MLQVRKINRAQGCKKEKSCKDSHHFDCIAFLPSGGKILTSKETKYLRRECTSCVLDGILQLSSQQSTCLDKVYNY